VVALMVSFIILSLVSFFQTKGVPRFISFILSLGVIGLVIFTITQIINTNINEIILQAPTYQDKLTQIALEVAGRYNLNAQIILDQFVAKINIPSLVSSTVSITTSFVKNAGIILFFTIFILFESRSFGKKIELVTG
jgi:AI-2 transport protein TqsA